MASGNQVGASLQHEAARRALTIIAKSAKGKNTLSYQSLALNLGWKPTHARATAQVCDLLDAAATLAHRPLMALCTVRNTAGEINPQAWKKNALSGLRELLIAEAQEHEFSDVDEIAIRGALDQLIGLGNRKAWSHVSGIVSQNQMRDRLEGREPPSAIDSLNDLGTDEPPVVSTTGRRYIRDAAVRAAVMKRAKGKCEFCKAPGFKCSDGKIYLESHHIIALSKEGEDRMTNVIALCAGHHREAHFGEFSEHIEKQMLIIVQQKEGKTISTSSNQIE